MTARAPSSLLEEIASTIVMTDASDAQGLGEVLKGLRSLEQELKALPQAQEQLLIQSIDIFESLIEQTSAQPDKDFERASSAISQLQTALRHGVPTPGAKAPEAPSQEQQSAGQAEFVLPDWVELTVFREFLAAQKLVLDEIESDILSLEKGDPAGAAGLRRRIHTMKGEAGVLGLDGLSELCHAVEDYLANSQNCADKVDKLLQVRDWISAAVESYARYQLPRPAVGTIIEILKNATGSPQAASPAPAPSAPEPAVAPEPAAAPAPSPPEARPAQAPPPAPSPSPAAQVLHVPQASPVGAQLSHGPAVSTPPRPEPESPAAPMGHVDRDSETLAMFGEFLQEGEEGLSRADQTLMAIERDGGGDADGVNSLFRIFHTIKGVAGMLELAEMSSLAHTTETLLNKVRQGEMELKGGIVDLVFNATEMMRVMLVEVRKAVEQETDVAAVSGLASLLRDIEAAIAGRPVIEEELPPAQPGEMLGAILTRPPLNIPSIVVEQALEGQVHSGRRLGEELVAQGQVPAKFVAQGLRAQARSNMASAAAEPMPVAAAPVIRQAPVAPVAAPAPAPVPTMMQPPAPAPAAQTAQAAAQNQAAAQAKLTETIKVDLGRVDNLVEMIGELVIAEAMVANAPDILSLTSPRVRKQLSQLTKITRDLQDIGMRMRMVPVRGVFQKMARMVRDLSRKEGKQIRFVQSGEGTEMDRSMVEQIADPLVHMIRNSVDHGIESAEDRIKANKPSVGTIQLSAYQEGGTIVIEVSDDGKGLDRDAITRKAIAQGLIKEGEKLSDSEIYNLIFMPGFSTAKQVTEISGRGVGMDVVRRNIEQMRGRIQTTSVAGKGTTFKIILPLTLAIIDGMLVACGHERYIIPTLSIFESIQPDRSMLIAFAGKGELVNVRGEILPLVRVDRLLGINDAKSDPTRGLVVVVESMGRKVGLLVDEVITQQQVVIKTLGPVLQDVSFVAGAAILSDGKVGLILNVDEIGNLADRTMVDIASQRASLAQDREKNAQAQSSV